MQVRTYTHHGLPDRYVNTVCVVYVHIGTALGKHFKSDLILAYPCSSLHSFCGLNIPRLGTYREGIGVCSFVYNDRI